MKKKLQSEKVKQVIDTFCVLLIFTLVHLAKGELKSLNDSDSLLVLIKYSNNLVAHLQMFFITQELRATQHYKGQL